MRTISEMQAELKDISFRINELTKELSEYSQSSSENITIDFKLIYSIGCRKPIKGHMLARQSEILKKRYITLLIALVNMATSNQVKGWLLIQRIACGVGLNERIENLAADGFSLTGNILDKCTSDIVVSKLANAFALDSMLIYLSCEQNNKKMLRFMSELFELTGCGNMEVTEMLEISKIIATQDKKACSRLQTKKLQTNKMAFSCYIKDLKVTKHEETKR